MTKPVLTILSVFLLLSKPFYGQGIDHSLYTSVNIFLVNPNPTDNIPDNEFYKIDSNILTKKTLSKKITAFVGDSIIKSKYSDGNLFVGYFINNTDDTLAIDRCDDAIRKAEIQVLINNKWVTFQLNLPSDCGSSYFTTKLPPKTYYVIQIPDPTDGNIDTKLRVKFNYDKTVFYTNAVAIKLTKERIAKTKEKIKPVPW